MKQYFIILTFFIPCFLQASDVLPFALTDSDPNSPQFRKKFLASYGVNSAIEPSFEQKDRELYEKVAPFLTSNPDRAIQIVESELNTQSNAAFHFLLGNLYYGKNNFRDAEKQLLIAIKKFPDFRRAYRTLALIKIRQDQMASSIPYWLKVITLGGGDGQSYGLLAYGYLREEKYSSALQAYRMARMFTPDSQDFRRGEAQCLLAMGNFEQAIALLDELILEDPKNAALWKTQANALIARNQYDDAISNLEIIKNLGNADWQTIALLGDLYLNRGIFDLGLQSYQEALRSNNLTLEQTFKPLATLLKSRLYLEAEGYLETMKPYLPKTLPKELAQQLDLAQARIFLENDEDKQARSLLNPILANDPLQGEALMMLGELEQKLENYAASSFHYERALGLSDYQAIAYEKLGSLAIAEKKYDQAIDFFEKSIQIKDNQNIRIYLKRIKALVQ